MSGDRGLQEARLLREDDDFWLFSEEADDQQTLVDVLDRLLDRGVVIVGDLTISVAGVNLLFVGLKAFIASAERMEEARGAMIAKMRGPEEQGPETLEPKRGGLKHGGRQAEGAA
ncbi:MAG: gas vesicle protein [Pseudomonadota bacterium]